MASDFLDLEPIKQRLAAATPGPWRVSSRFRESSGTKIHESVICDFGLGDYEIAVPWSIEDTAEGDAELVANAPADLAALVAEVEMLRSALAGHRITEMVLSSVTKQSKDSQRRLGAAESDAALYLSILLVYANEKNWRRSSEFYENTFDGGLDIFDPDGTMERKNGFELAQIAIRG